MQNKGVIINVYIESSKPNQRNDPIKKINPNSISFQPRFYRTQGYDRRAQLLAYAQELRHANAQQIQWPSKNSRPNHKYIVQ
ncbi:hypothetical protein ACJIZ3_024560 [Penstemon smallii]|uniref:Uncharacterized protein n=1 Tax=Penstemon smallii TaxID=265156 RepID=A0ABD3TS86_9LAMI